MTSCLDHVHQVVSRGKDVLSNEEIRQLQKNGDELQRRYDGTIIQSDELLRKLISGLDELQKLKVYSYEVFQISIFRTSFLLKL